MGERFQPHVFAAYLKNDGKHAQEDGTLYEWSGTHWNPLSDSTAERNAYHWLVENRLEHASHENAARAIAAAMHFCPEVPKLTDDVVIPCQNGYVHVINGRLHLEPADPKLGLRHVLSCNYGDPVEAAARFVRFIEMVLPDAEVRSRVQEYLGYTLTADARYQRAQLWLGSGANGKGVLANIVQELHGRPECVRLDSLDGFGMSALIGASLIYSDEVPRGRIDEQLLKSMIAGERVQVDRKYRMPLSVRIRGKWLVLGNHLPTIGDHSSGFWRRWDVVPFMVTIPEGDRNPNLAETIIREELSGVLCWALEGLLRLQLRGAFSPVLPRAMAEVLRQVKNESNVVQAWLDDCSPSITVDVETKKDDVYAHFKMWCERNTLRAEPATRFWPELARLFKFEEGRPRVGKQQIRKCNIKLN